MRVVKRGGVGSTTCVGVDVHATSVGSGRSTRIQWPKKYQLPVHVPSFSWRLPPVFYGDLLLARPVDHMRITSADLLR